MSGGILFVVFVWAALVPVHLVHSEGVSCSSYCVALFNTPIDRTDCISGCVLGYQITSLSKCICNTSSCVSGCSRVIRCSRCVDGGCEITQDKDGFTCSVTKATAEGSSVSSGMLFTDIECIFFTKYKKKFTLRFCPIRKLI